MLKEKLAILLLDSEYRIEGMCKKFIKMIGFNKYFKISINTFNESLSFDSICPDFDQESENKQQNVILVSKNIIPYINTDSISNTIQAEQMQVIRNSMDKRITLCSTPYDLTCGLKYYLIFVVYRRVFLDQQILL